MNRYPAKPMMDEMARHGRYGDSMLVHMHPAEVAGIASLVPGGLTRNPVTGQPEAFAFLAPMLLGAAGVSLSPLAAAAVTGGVSAIVNKDLGKGLLDGITGFASGALGKGLGELLGTAGDSATQAVTTLGGDAASQAATEIGAQTAQELASQIPQIPNAGDIIEGTVLPELPAGTITNINSSAIPGATGIDLDLSNLKLRPENISAQGVEFGKQGTDITKMTPSQFTERVSDNMNTGTIRDILQKPPEPNLSLAQRLNKGIRGVGTMGQLGIAGVAQGAKGDMEMREANRAQAEALRAEGEASRAESRADLNRAYAVARPDIPVGIDYDTRRSEMSRRTAGLLPVGAAGGGQVQKMDQGGKAPDLSAVRDAYRFIGGPRGYGGRDATTIQKDLRGQDIIAPPKDYMPGFEPEFSYFQNLTRDPDGNIVGTPDVPDRGYRPMRQGVISRSQYFDPILQSPQSNAQMNEYRRTLEKLDPGPLDEASVMGLASEGSTLSTAQQNMFEQYAPLAPFNMAQRDRLSELTDRGMSLSEAIANQEQTRAKGYDLDGDGVVTDAEFTGATTEPATPDVPDYVKGLDPEVQARIQEYMDNLDPETAKLLASLPTGGLGYLGGLNFNFAQGGQIPEKMPEVGPAPAPQVGPPPTGGDIPIRTSMMESTVPDGGIARVPTEFTRGADGGMPPEVEMRALQSAVLGEVSEGLASQIIDMFIQKYGSDVFQLARDTILRGVVPNAQTEGMISGPGGGMDDMVQGMIGSEQPVAVSPGEFIVPADVVSGIGDGSSDAGAKKLDTMMERVRVERNGTTKQAPRINERKVMPA